jgi:hypothetical protein
MGAHGLSARSEINCDRSISAGRAACRQNAVLPAAVAARCRPNHQSPSADPACRHVCPIWTLCALQTPLGRPPDAETVAVARNHCCPRSALPRRARPSKTRGRRIARPGTRANAACFLWSRRALEELPTLRSLVATPGSVSARTLQLADTISPDVTHLEVANMRPGAMRRPRPAKSRLMLRFLSVSRQPHRLWPRAEPAWPGFHRWPHNPPA